MWNIIDIEHETMHLSQTLHLNLSQEEVAVPGHHNQAYPQGCAHIPESLLEQLSTYEQGYRGDQKPCPSNTVDLCPFSKAYQNVPSHHLLFSRIAELEEEVKYVLEDNTWGIEDSPGELDYLANLLKKADYTEVKGYKEARSKLLSVIGHHNLMKYPNCIEFKRAHKPDDTVQQLTFSHGMKFWNQSMRTVEDIIRDIPLINSIEGELCCSQQCKHLGPVGVYVQGEVTFGAVSDIGSEWGPNGVRVFHELAEWQVITNVSQIEDENSYDYHEFHIAHPKVTGIWVKEDTYVSKWASKTGPLLEKLANKMGVMYSVVPENKH